jgi:hypothetical protein
MDSLKSDPTTLRIEVGALILDISTFRRKA